MGKKVVSLEERVPQLKEIRKKKAKKKLKKLLSALFVMILVVLYFQSPYSKLETIQVNGNEYLTDEEIAAWCELDADTVYLSLRYSKLEEKILSHPEIKSASFERDFPNGLTINVEEYKVVGYFTVDEKLYPVLETGYVVKDKEIGYSTPLPVFINFSEDEVFKKTVTEISKLPTGVKNCISEVYYYPTQTADDLVLLYMSDGNLVRVIPDTLSDNMEHYSSIVAQNGPQKGVFDMEVGVFFKSYEQIQKEMAAVSAPPPPATPEQSAVPASEEPVDSQAE